MFHQVLATGVHGILLCHTDTPGAVRAFVEAVRLPIHKQAVGKGLSEGRRGAHGSPTAAPIWGISAEEHNQKADVWPLNPNGELVLGLKLEDSTPWRMPKPTSRFRVSRSRNGDQVTCRCRSELPGPRHNRLPRCAPREPGVRGDRHQIFFLEGMAPDNIIAKIKEGVRGPASPEATEIGRKFTKRQMPR